MLIETDISQLGDKRLAGDELIAREKEKTQAQLDTKRIPDQTDLENREAGMGQVLPCSEFLRLLGKICPGLLIEKGGYPNSVALRRWINGEKKYVTGFQLLDGYIPEYSTVFVDENKLPVGEIRGWRNILIALLKQGLLNMEAIKKEFQVATSNSVHGKFWESQTKGRQ